MTDITPLAHKYYLTDVERRADGCIRRVVERQPTRRADWAFVQLERFRAAAVGLLHQSEPAQVSRP